MGMMKTLRMKFRLPKWAKWKDGHITADFDQMYRAYLTLLGVQVVDQYWLEVCRRCALKDLRILCAEPYTIEYRGTARWKLKNFPRGKGPVRGAMEFMEHYEKLVATRSRVEKH